jgi:hypothetical protein
MRVCTEAGCPVLIPTAGRCAAHAKAKEERRGSRHQRGYGKAHTALREQWKPKVAEGSVLCARCGEPIYPHEAWDLGHDDNDRSMYNGPEHANRCNRSAGGRAAHR